jgi:hypothetical protein
MDSDVPMLTKGVYWFARSNKEKPAGYFYQFGLDEYCKENAKKKTRLILLYRSESLRTRQNWHA